MPPKLGQKTNLKITQLTNNALVRNGFSYFYNSMLFNLHYLITSVLCNQEILSKCLLTRTI